MIEVVLAIAVKSVFPNFYNALKLKEIKLA